MTLYGAIDIGTNSTRLLIAGWQQGRWEIVERGLVTTRIGAGGRDGQLTPPGMERTVQVLKDFAGRLQAWDVRRFRVVATSAVREAPNAGDFLNRAITEAGVEVEIIPGREEAWLSYQGAAGDRNDAGVIDIGGGSTEIIYPSRAGLSCASIPVGAIRIKNYYQDQSCWLPKLHPALTLAAAMRLPVWIGVGGTVTTLAAIKQGLTVYHPELVHGYILTTETINQLLVRLQGLNLEERRQLPGLQPERADIIPTGAAILAACLDNLHAAAITCSDRGLLDGIIRELAGPVTE